ncbi:hypothetical protein RFI_15540 [Reticulomyxa filosa]|uniref:Uncharacterized protein n=1 Tax=Reticulomyxa filosa TaxID=46433 RepID=X6N8M4_RETFI|nr:hypothetical protein RFI_15540 [Reticulomyxa filosa]|eukprot:ETO21662.1 hypothetical protein RFI_15540 [Reticulomyxa filosa]
MYCLAFLLYSFYNISKKLDVSRHLCYFKIEKLKMTTYDKKKQSFSQQQKKGDQKNDFSSLPTSSFRASDYNASEAKRNDIPARPKVGIWNWVREHCFLPFMAAFQQQLFTEVFQTAAHIISTVPHKNNKSKKIYYVHIMYLCVCMFVKMLACKDLIAINNNKNGIGNNNGNNNDNTETKKSEDNWKTFALALSGVFLVSMTATVCVMFITGDSTSQHPQQKRNKN